MKTILVPIDFSDNAAKALKYAVNLSEKFSAKVVLLHSYYTIHSNVYEKLETGIPIAEQTANDDLKMFYKELFPNGNHNVVFVSGGESVVNEIVKKTKEMNVDLIVMATDGLDNRLGRLLLNTNTSLVVEEASCPVIVIPGDTNELNQKMKNLVYGAEYIESDIVNLKTVAKIASLFGANLEVVHVVASENITQKNRLEEFEQRVKKEINYENIIFNLLQGYDVEETLSLHLKDKKTDLLIMSTKHRKLMDKVFNKSITKSMALYLNIPLMVFHHKAE